MKKYRLLKDLPFMKEGEYEYNMSAEYGSQLKRNGNIYNIPLYWFSNEEWFEEIKEPKSIYNLEKGDDYYHISTY